MLTSKQRAYLRSIANTIEPIFQIGKEGIGGSFIDQINKALEAREIVKLTILNNSLTDTHEAAEELASKTGAEVVQKIGNRIVLYKKSENNQKIFLP